MSWQTQALALLTASLLRPFALAAAAWLVLRIFRVRHPVSRHAVWTAVLAGMLVLPAASVWAPHWQLRVLAPKADALPSISTAPDALFAAAPEILSSEAPAGPPRPRFQWPPAETVLLWFYLAGCLGMAAYRAAGWILLRRVMARSVPVRGSRLLESDDVTAPVAVGVLRPAVILPASWRAWSAGTRRAVLAHEFEHLRRRDGLVAAATRFAKCVLWFHPLTWWISQQIADLAELSCDAAVLERGGDPAGYSRVLLAFAEAVQGAGHRAALPGLAMASKSGLGRRIDEVFRLAGTKPTKLFRPRLLLAVFGFPVLCLAASVGLGARSGPPKRRTPTTLAAPLIQVAQDAAPAADPMPGPAAPQPPEEQGRPAVTPVRTPGPTASPEAKPKFEVSSVKLCKDAAPLQTSGPRGGRGSASSTPERLELPCLPVRLLIQMSFIFPTVRHGEYGAAIEGGPAWMESERYQISAKADGPVGRGMLTGPMLQSLLEDRFRLKVHRETREAPTFDLVVAKGGLKLLDEDDRSCTADNAPGSFQHLDCSKIKWHKAGTCIEWDRSGSPPPLNPDDPRIPCGIARGTVSAERRVQDIQGATMNEIAHVLSNSGRLVYDRTGIAGLFDFHAEFLPDGVDSPDDAAIPSVFSALGKLGLKLEPAKGPREYFVIDHIERPTEN